MRGVLVAMLLVGVLAASAPQPSGGEPGPGATAAAPAAWAGLPARVDYVALGDSFSAGPLVDLARSDPSGCLRSTNNYPAFLAGYLSVRSYRDVTCSGAATRDLLRPQALIAGTEPSPAAQQAALRRGTDLVTVGIGGNDFGLFGSLISVCTQLAPTDPTGSPCREHFTDAGGADTKARDARRIEAHVSQVLRLAKRRAPHARIVVVGYPRLLPIDGSTCSAAGLATGDYRWADHIGRLLNASLHRAAVAHHVGFVGLYRASAGHDICAGRHAWVNGKDLAFGRAAPYHPLRQGMRGAAAEIFRRLTHTRAPASQRAEPPPGSVITNPSP